MRIDPFLCVIMNDRPLLSGSSRRAVAGTPKGAAGLARDVPTRAKNEPGRADDVTGQTSDRR